MIVCLGSALDAIMQEFCVDNDVDQAVCAATEEETSQPIMDVDYVDAMDGAIVWQCIDGAGEEDLVDVFVDAMSSLNDGGLIRVLIPRPRRPNSVRVDDMKETTKIAGLHTMTSTALGNNWAGVHLTARPRSHR